MYHTIKLILNSFVRPAAVVKSKVFRMHYFKKGKNPRLAMFECNFTSVIDGRIKWADFVYLVVPCGIMLDRIGSGQITRSRLQTESIMWIFIKGRMKTKGKGKKRKNQAVPISLCGQEGHMNKWQMEFFACIFLLFCRYCLFSHKICHELHNPQLVVWQLWLLWCVLNLLWKMLQIY